jgi:hypothetical protein
VCLLDVVGDPDEVRGELVDLVRPDLVDARVEAPLTYPLTVWK